MQMRKTVLTKAFFWILTSQRVIIFKICFEVTFSGFIPHFLIALCLLHALSHAS